MWCSSGAEMRSDCAVARSVVRSATAIRSSGEAKRTPCSWRWTSAKRLAREKVARRSATLCTATRGRIGQDHVGQIAGAQQGQIIAIGETRDPGALVGSDVALGPLAPPAGHLGQAAVFFGRPGLERGPAA